MDRYFLMSIHYVALATDVYFFIYDLSHFKDTSMFLFTVRGGVAAGDILTYDTFD